MQYRRSQQKGGLFFFTINLAERHSDLLIREIELLRSSFRKVKSMHPFSLPAAVVMPDHLHLLMRLPNDDNDYPLRIRLIKTHFSKGLDKVERIRASVVGKASVEFGRGVIGNIRSVMIGIGRRMWITFITTR